MGNFFSSDEQQQQQRQQQIYAERLREQERERLREREREWARQRRIVDEENRRKRIINQRDVNNLGAVFQNMTIKRPEEIKIIKIEGLLTNLLDTFSLQISNRAYWTVELEEFSTDFYRIKNLFRKTNKNCFVVTQIEKVDNPYLQAQYKLCQRKYDNLYNSVEEKELFHGTKACNINSICENNFNWRLRGTARGHKFGQGVSFSPIANYATHYGDKTYEKVMLVAKVLVANTCAGESNMVLPPAGYDTTVNDRSHVYVKYEDNAFYPAFIIRYSGFDQFANKKHRNY